MGGRLWSLDESGEPWLGDANENPYLMVANPKRRRKGPRKGVMPPALRRYWATHSRKRRARKNPSTAVARIPASRVTVMRKNPSRARRAAAGFLSRFPNVETVGGLTLGFVAPNFIQSALAGYLPASLMASQIGYWAVKVASAILPPMLIKKLGQVKLGANMLIGGIVSLVVDAGRKFFPSFFGMGAQPMLGYYTTGQAAPARLPMRAQARGLGMYTPNAYPSAGALRPMVATVPSRLAPGDRF